MRDAALDGGRHRPPRPHIDHRVQRPTSWAVIGWSRTLWSCSLIGQSSLQVVEPGLTAVLLLETERDAPDERRDETQTGDVTQRTAQPIRGQETLECHLV